RRIAQTGSLSWSQYRVPWPKRHRSFLGLHGCSCALARPGFLDFGGKRAIFSCPQRKKAEFPRNMRLTMGRLPSNLPTNSGISVVLPGDLRGERMADNKAAKPVSKSAMLQSLADATGL